MKLRLARLDVAAGQLVLVGEGDAVDDEVERAPEARSTSAKTASMVAGIGDVAMADDRRAELLRQRLDPLLQRVALIGEGELGARAARAAWAMPQAIERLFATPMIRPRLPARMPGPVVSAMNHLAVAERA